MSAVRARRGERFGRRVTLSEEDVSRFASLAGDENPLHHAPDFAAGTRLGRVIASGTQTSSLLMACTASHFSRTGPMLGLEFRFRFKQPVFAGETLAIEWLVVAVRPSGRLRGELVELRGRMQDAAGVTVVGASGRVLLRETL